MTTTTSTFMQSMPTVDMNVQLGLQYRQLVDTPASLAGEPDMFCGAFARVFFSAANIQALQNALRRYVYVHSQHQYLIDPQNEHTLHILMRAAFQKYYLQCYDPTATDAAEADVAFHVAALNQWFVDLCGDPLLDAARGHLQFIADRDAPVPSLPMPQNTCVRLEKTTIDTRVTQNRVPNLRATGVV